MALYVSNTTTHERLDIGMIAAESVCMEAGSSRGKIAVASIYRPPRANVHQFSEELEICIKAVRKNYENILLLGESNATHSSWLLTDKTDSMGESLYCLLSILNLQQHTNFSTHIHLQLPSACLDLVISNISSEDLSVASLPPLGASDHIVISGDIKYITKQLNYVSKPNRTSWKWSQNAVGRLRQALLTTNLVPEVPHNRSVNGFWSHWKYTGDFTGRTALQNPTTTPQYATTAEPIPTMDHHGPAYRDQAKAQALPYLPARQKHSQLVVIHITAQRSYNHAEACEIHLCSLPIPP